jgi:serine/threonine-protein kinase RsbW
LSRFRIVIESDLAGVFVISAVVRGVCDRLGMDTAETSSVELCVVEAVTNCIKHAYGGAPDGEVCLEVCYTPERLDLEVRDQGASMPEEHRSKLQTGSGVFEFDPANLNGIPEGGMGLEIMRQLMDECAYWTEGATNCLKLTKLLGAARLKEASL